MNNKNLKKKICALLCAAATAASTMMAGGIPVYADATKVVSIGNDLTVQQKQTILRYFGIENDQSVQKIRVTNQDEINHLSSYIPLEQIGTRTVSCAYIKPTESGGIKVRTANLQYVTANMIASTLADLGIHNCEVVAACPFKVSGTGALTGIIMAYETATGETLDQAKKAVATQDVVVTKDLAQSIGTVQAEYVVNEAKTQAVENNITDPDEIQQTVTNIVTENNINITQEQINNITNLTENVVNQNYGDTYVDSLNDINNNIKEEVDASEDIDIDIEAKGEDLPEEPEAVDSITADLDESILGDDVIASSTDDASLIVETGTATITDEPEQPEALEEQTEEQPFEIFSEEEAEEQPEAAAEEEITEGEEEISNADEMEDIVIPENGFSDYGFDIQQIIDKCGEDSAKDFLRAEKWLMKNFAYDETNQKDIDASPEIPENATVQMSYIAKSVMDVYYAYLTTDEHDKDLNDTVMETVNKLVSDGDMVQDKADELEKLLPSDENSADDTEDDIEMPAEVEMSKDTAEIQEDTIEIPE